MGKAEQAKKQLSVGGFAFFSSLFFLCLLSVLNISLLPDLWNVENFPYLVSFGIGMIPGGFIAMYFIQGHPSVLIHEFKHSLVSGLAGNRARGLKVKKDSGYFEYEYTSRTAEYNAFISLAPYIIPLFTFPALLLAYGVWRYSHELMVAVVGIGYGIDIILNVRDISRRQTDLTMIRGGYRVALLYITAMNLTIASILMAWVLQGWFGIRYLAYGLWQVVLHLVAYYHNAPSAI